MLRIDGLNCWDLDGDGIEDPNEDQNGDSVWDARDCDLIAMSTHGHRFLADLFLGETATRVQHQVTVPVLLLKVP